MKELRPYQIKFINNIREKISINKRVIAQLPTGGGKTFCFISITKMAIEKGKTVLILTESRKIMQQIIKEQHGKIIAAGVFKFFIKPKQVYIAMVQTLSRRQEMIDNFAHLKDELLIINDEAHIGTSVKLLRQLPDAYLIGFTATPNFRDSKFLAEIYQDIAEGPQVRELISEGFLMPYRHYARVGADMDELKIKNGEFTEESQERAFSTNIVFDGLANDLKKNDYKYCMVFGSSIKHAQTIQEHLKDFNIASTIYHSQLSKEEGTANMYKYTSGQVPVCISVGALTRGYDFVPTDLIAIVRATTSLSLFLQIIGRASRPSPLTGKTGFKVLDYGLNFERFGLWDDERDWSELASAKPKTKKKEAPAVRSCVNCESIIPVSTRVCPFCGYERPQEEKEIPESVLVEVTPDDTKYNELRGKNVHSLSAEELAAYAKFLKKQTFASLIARWRESQEPGFLKAFGEAMGYKKGFAYMQKKLEIPNTINDFVIN